VLCHDPQLGVGLLRQLDQHGERPIGGNAMALHQDAFRLPDDVAGVQRIAKLALLVRPGHRGGRVGGEHGPQHIGFGAEHMGAFRVQAHRPEVVSVDGERQAQDAAHAEASGHGDVARPAGLYGGVLDVHGDLRVRGHEARALTGLVEQGTDRQRNLAGCGAAFGRSVSVQQQHAAVLGAGDRAHRRLGDGQHGGIDGGPT